MKKDEEPCVQFFFWGANRRGEIGDSPATRSICATMPSTRAGNRRRAIGDGARTGPFFACVAVNLHRINGFLRWPDLRQRRSTLKVELTKVFQSEGVILQLPTCLAPQSGSVPYSGSYSGYSAG